MGCAQITGIKTFVLNESIDGQGQLALEVFMNLGLEPRDLNLLYTCFWDIDADDSGTISPIELFTYFNLDLGQFERSIFSVFDEDKSGKLNFMEFVCCMWNLLTFEEKDLGIIAFMMKDPTAMFKITHSEIKDMIEIIHRKKVDQSQALQLLYSSLKRSCSAEVSIQEFCKWTSDNISVLSPLLILQIKFRKEIIGDVYWKRMAKDRAANPHLGGFSFVKELQEVVMKKNAEFKQAKRDRAAETARNKRLGIGADGRDNVSKKQSVLLGLFGMKPVTQRAAVYCDENTQHTEPAEEKRGLTKMKAVKGGGTPTIKGFSDKSKSSKGSSGKSGKGGGGGSSSKKDGRTPLSSDTGASSSSGGGGGAVSGGETRRRRSLVKPNLVDRDAEAGKARSGK